MPIKARVFENVIRVGVVNYDEYPAAGPLVWAEVDPCNSWVLDYKWHTIKGGYVATTIGRSTVLLHRLILPEAKEVDHIDRNKLNNRKVNLREASRSVNTQNTEPRGISGYRGVRRVSQNSWKAYTQLDGKPHTIGHFPTAELAARAYNTMARQLYGDNAYQNTIEESEQPL